MLVFRPTAIIASLVLGAPLVATVHAQTTASQASAATCSIDEGKPGEVARAYLAVSQVASAQAMTLDQQKAKLAESVRLLSQLPPTADNPVGRAYEMGKLLVLWTTLPGVSMTMQRGTVGYVTDPTGMINLPAAIDSAFDLVEAAKPECASQLLQWRSQKGWITLVNQSIHELQVGSIDSAEAHARETLLFNDQAPYAYMVLGQIAEQRQQTDSAIALFQKTIQAASSDSSYTSVKQQTELNLGNIAAAAAAAAQDSAKKMSYDELARTNLQALAADTTASAAYRESAKAALVNVSLAMGDSASAKSSYAAQLADPSKFAFREVLQAGVSASRLGDDSAALKLFHAAYEKNPYHRDALTNLAIYELRAEHYDTARTLLARLKEIDPNGNNTRLEVLTYAGLATHFQHLNNAYVTQYQKAKSAKVKAALTDSAAMTADSNTYYSHKAVETNIRADSVPVLVSFTQFSNVQDTVTLAGTIENNTPASQTYTMKVDFLDATGTVVASQSQTVGPVGSKEAGRFSVTVTAPGITAFKYAPLDH